MGNMTTINWNDCINKSETWSWKYEVGIKEGIVVNPPKGLVAQGKSRGVISLKWFSSIKREIA